MNNCDNCGNVPAPNVFKGKNFCKECYEYIKKTMELIKPAWGVVDRVETLPILLRK